MANEIGVKLLTEVSLERLRAMADSAVVIGDPITLPNGVTAVPVSRVSIGFGVGGADRERSTRADAFSGGSGGGVTITPIAFLVTQGDSVRVMLLDTIGSTADNLVRSIPEMIDKISDLVRKK